MGIKEMTPYQKLVSFGKGIREEFCLFPPLILDYLTTKEEILESPKTVQEPDLPPLYCNQVIRFGLKSLKIVQPISDCVNFYLNLLLIHNSNGFATNTALTNLLT